MGHKYTNWVAKSDVSPLNYEELLDLVRQNRGFESVESLQYGGITDSKPPIMRF